MISQELIDNLETAINESDGQYAPYFDCNDIKELIASYKQLIEDNAELHKVNAKLRTENKELYQESARDKGL